MIKMTILEVIQTCCSSSYLRTRIFKGDRYLDIKYKDGKLIWFDIENQEEFNQLSSIDILDIYSGEGLYEEIK